MANALDQIHHVTICVADMDRAVAWYTTSASCEVIARDPRQATLQFSNIRLVLTLPSQEQPHIALVRPDAAKFGELMENRDGTRSTFVADSTGNLVELVEQSSVTEGLR